MGFVSSTVNNGGQKFAVMSCATPSLFGPSKRVLFAPLVHVLGRLPPCCQFIFKTLTGFTSPEHLSFDASPLPTQNCLIRARRS